MRHIQILLILALLLFFAAACSGTDSRDSGQVSVLATTSLVGDVAGQVGGEHIDLTVMLPLGSDPHSYDPSPRDVVAIAEADIVMLNGLDLEEFIQPLLANAGEETAVVTVSDGIETLAFVDEHGEVGPEKAGGQDPHVWMDPANVMIWAENIAAALSQADPENAASYRANVAAYTIQLEELDTWIRQQVADLESDQRVLVTDHDTFGYFATAYDFDLVGAIIPGFSTQSSPSAGELADLQNAIREHGVPAIFVGSTVSPQLADQIGADLGVDVVLLYSGSLSAADGPAASYLDFMLYNVTAIVEALGSSR